MTKEEFKELCKKHNIEITKTKTGYRISNSIRFKDLTEVEFINLFTKEKIL